jgi:hypothetical protein
MTDLDRLRAVVELLRAGLRVRDVAELLRVHELAVRAILKSTLRTQHE